MKQLSILIFAVLITCPGLNQAQKSYLKQTGFRPAQIWSDSNGMPINAHGGGILYFRGIYYWYGTHKIEGLSEKTFADGGIHCYASNDLITWSDKGLVLSLVYNDDSHDLAYQCNFDRPKVVYNVKTKKFVAFFKLYLKGKGVTTGYVGVALSDSPSGLFTYSHKFLGAGSPNGSGDYAMFQEENGDLYHLTVRKPDKAFVAGKMSDDYLLPEGDYVVCEGITKGTEAPAIVKRNGTYHLLGSGSTGWDPNPARCFTSKSLTGPWMSQGNPCEGVNPENGFGKEKTFGGQSTFILPVIGRKDAYIAVFDINKPENPYDSRHIWLPVTIEDDKFLIRWRDSWDLSVFGSDKKDLQLPALENGLASPGKRVAVVPTEYEGKGVHHLLYLPPDWDPDWKKKGRSWPVIVEYTGNRFPTSGSTGEVEGASLGYGLSGGKFIWAVLPFVAEDHQHNEVSWWGDEQVTVAYAKSNVPRICREFGGDSARVFICGFSRGAIAVNYIGLFDDEIAKLWCGFITHDHYDGVREWKGTAWGSPLANYREAAVQRLNRLQGRPVLICQNGGTRDIEKYLIDYKYLAEFTFLEVPVKKIFPQIPNPLMLHPHTDRWMFVDSEERQRVWNWMEKVSERKIN